MIKQIVFICLSVMCVAFSAFAAQKEDFMYEGVGLGDDHEKMVEKLGTPRVDIDHIIGDKVVTYYFYQDSRVGIDPASGKIVDIRIADKKYTTANGIKLGATQHKMIKEYGKPVKEKISGHIYYIYHNELKPEERLMLDVGAGYLEEIRITNLDA